MEALEIRRRALDSREAQQLIAALNAELSALFPEPGANHFSLAAAQVADGDGAFLVAYAGDAPVGCGAVRRLDAETAELKRMYVAPSHRGRGVGRRLVEALEAEARRLGVSRVVLETGSRLDRAIKMYTGLGYAPIPLYGEYLDSPATSRCFGKRL
jgi:GNAT superfamily N-acetyltransferase